MNIKYNYNCLRYAIALSAVSFVAGLYYYLLKNGYTTGPDNAENIASLLFCTCGAISVIMMWTVNFRREIIEKELKIKKEKQTFLSKLFSRGVLRFFSNEYTITVDMLLIMLIVNLIIIYAVGIKSAVYTDILKIALLWFVYMHGILNGRNYEFFRELFEIQSNTNKK